MIIKEYGDPVLVHPAEMIPQDQILSKDIQALCEQMYNTISHQRAVGIAAPQIGVSQRIFVITTEFMAPGRYPLKPSDYFGKMILINPELSEPSAETTVMMEGCLSFRELRVPVARPTQIRVKAFNEKAEPLDFIATGFLARAIQHETDHLNGIVMLERVAVEDFKSGGFKSVLDALKL